MLDAKARSHALNLLDWVDRKKSVLMQFFPVLYVGMEIVSFKSSKYLKMIFQKQEKIVFIIQGSR